MRENPLHIATLNCFRVERTKQYVCVTGGKVVELWVDSVLKCCSCRLVLSPRGGRREIVVHSVQMGSFIPSCHFLLSQYSVGVMTKKCLCLRRPCKALCKSFNGYPSNIDKVKLSVKDVLKLA